MLKRPRGEVAIGEVREGIGPEEHQRLELAAGRGREHAGGVEPACGRYRAPLLGEVGTALVQGDPPGKQAWRAPEIDRAVHVAAPQRGEEAGRRPGAGEQAGGGRDLGRRLGQRRATEHDDDSVAGLPVDKGPGESSRLPGLVGKPGGDRAEAARGR